MRLLFHYYYKRIKIRVPVCAYFCKFQISRLLYAKSLTSKRHLTKFYGQIYCNNSSASYTERSGSLMVFKYIDILGESADGFDGAVQNAVSETAKTVKDVRQAEVIKLNVIVSDDKIVEYQALMRVMFKVKR